MALVFACFVTLLAVTQFSTADRFFHEKSSATRTLTESFVPQLSEPSAELLLEEGCEVLHARAAEPETTIPPVPNDHLLEVLLLVLAALAVLTGVNLRLLQKAENSQPEASDLRTVREATDAFGCTALHVAAASARAVAPAHAEKLLRAGADPNAREAWEETPLHMAARHGNLEVAQALLKFGAQINARNLDEVTPLLAAAQEGQQEVCNFLLEMGANAGGLEEQKLPCLLHGLLMQRMVCKDPKAQVY
ncbi:unnamed protein product [Effrenium voratum]|uniref:Uncharacterized protein n=1 Tax=Effrenium voratum TaxID=2562239 RepID=A0AA36JI83_9DINO|nr:unnamed protein product [Effrenium voratum]CAJ1440390.1 unnamed protein product [Effrenium voratum]